MSFRRPFFPRPKGRDDEERASHLLFFSISFEKPLPLEQLFKKEMESVLGLNAFAMEEEEEEQQDLVVVGRGFDTDDDDDDDDDDDRASSLSKLLQILFGLNGLSLSLQSLPLMYVVNTQVEVPLSYLPTYGAVAFLPYSFKSIYGYLSSSSQTGRGRRRGVIPRYQLFAMLLIGNSIFLIWTTLIPPGGVFLVFLLAFLRGITDSWAEFCLGLTLIDQARRHCHNDDDYNHDHGRRINERNNNNSNNNFQRKYAVVASRFQAQAATMRNSGSLLGTFITCLIFLGRQMVLLLDQDETQQLSRGMTNTLLLSTACLQLIGSCGSILYRENFEATTTSRRTFKSNNITMTHTSSSSSSSTGSFRSLSQNEETSNGLDEESVLWKEDKSFPPYSSEKEQEEEEEGEGEEEHDIDNILNHDETKNHRQDQSLFNWLLVAILQLLLISLTLKGIIVELTSYLAWKFIIISLLLSILITAFATGIHNAWGESHQVGLFLILRSSVPSDSMVLGSFLYSLFQSTPLQLQLLSMISMLMTTLASWSYGKLFSRYSNGRPFLMVLAGTTILAALVSLCNMIVVSSSSSRYIFIIAIFVQAITTFVKEWSFLPEIVLATTSLSVTTTSDEGQQPRDALLLRNDGDDNDDDNKENTSKVDIEYGALVSCIDFGDQVGSLLTSPIVALLGISRENDWNNLNHLILLCSMASIVSLGLLKLLPKQK